MNKIAFPLKFGMQGPAVADLQEALRALVERGMLPLIDGDVRREALTALLRERKEKHFGDATRTLVAAFQAARALRKSGRVDRETARLIEDDLERLEFPTDTGSPAPKPGVEFGGVLFGERGQAAAGVVLRLYQRQFGKAPKRLGEAKADGQGRYRFDLTRTPDRSLELYAVDPDGEEIRLTGTLRKSPSGDSFDLVVPESVLTGDDEFSRLKAAVAGRIGGAPETLREAVEYGERRELSLLAETTGWDAAALALAADAFEVEERDKLPASAIYALARAGLSSDPRRLADVPFDAIDSALHAAADAGIVDQATVAPSLDALGRYIAKERYERILPGALSSAKDFAEKARITNEDKKAFAQALETARDSDLWELAQQAGVSAAGVKALRLQGKLAYLTFNNAELADHLAGAIKDDPRELIGQGYYEAAHWAAALQKMAGADETRLAALIPPAYSGASTSERLDRYAEELARRVRRMDPQAVTIERIGAGELKGLPHADEVTRFLRKATPLGFRLGQTPLGEFCATHRDAPWAGIDADRRDAVLGSLSRLVALYGISPDDTVLEALLQAGYGSATAIARSDYQMFRDRMLALLPDAYKKKTGENEADAGEISVIETVYSRAQQQSATVFNVFDGLTRLDTAAAPAGATPAEAAQRADQIAVARQKLSGRFPTLETLFGTVDYCHCEHCRSVLSPAAYLVDLLHFIDPDDDDWAMTRAAYRVLTGNDYGNDKPFVALDRRRPDLKHIALTCANTQTALPYIDVVNEVLEQLMASGTQVEIDAYDVGDLESADLVAEPHNVLWSAYVGTAGKSLREKVYPVSLPFDLPLEMARAFLRQLDLPLWQLRAAVARPAGLDPSAAGLADGWTDVWFEQLGLGPADVAVFIRASAWHELFGYATAGDALATVVRNGAAEPADESLRNARTLARRLDIDYATLVEMLRTRFVNPHIEHLIALQRLGIDPRTLDRYLAAGSPDMDAGERAAFATYLASLGVTEAEVAALRTEAILETTLEIHAPDSGCDFSRMTLAFERDPADPGAAYARVLHRMNALARLHHKLGLDVHELDRLLMALMPGATDVTLTTWPAAMKTALIHLAHVEVLRERFEDRLSREEIALFWSALPATGWNCLYDRLFSGAGLPGRSVPFAKRLGRVLQDTTQTIDASADVICEVMHLTHPDLAPILAAGAAVDDRLTLGNLSILLRHALLARGLGVTVTELLGHISLSEPGPFAALAGAPVNGLDADLPWSRTLAFVRELETARAAQADLEFIERICRHRGVEEAPDEDADPALLALLALPPAEPGQEAAQRDLVVKTLAAQLSLALPTVDFLLAEVLQDGAGRALKEVGFVDRATAVASLRRLRRAADLIRTLEITTDELAHLHGLSGALDPGALPTLPVTIDANARAMRRGLRPWLELVALRRRFGRSERILEVFAAASRQAVTASQPYDTLALRLHEAMAALTGLPLPGLADALAALGVRSATGSHFEVPALASAAELSRVLEALKCFQRIGLDSQRIVEFASRPVDDLVARQLHSSLKARYQRSAWRRMVQPIFDGLRRKQRDALVAHLTHVTRSDGKPRYGDTPEKLFEFLLLDPGMEPVVLASRIQLAISSVQLFVQRCLMNLEDDVEPPIIDNRRWEWMRRYRVWEANRKMFIWPENWLDPEFRDDKTHLFRELEGQLLQGDVNEDLVRNGFHAYLKGLEEIGRLQMTALYFEPGISAGGATLHVVGRSSNAPHRYYYRKVSHGMWTPWEPIDSGIEGDHLVLTSWRGRMHLFWLSFLEQTSENSGTPSTFTLGNDVSTAGLRPATRVDLQLHWVEHVNGRWVNRSSTPGFVETGFNGELATTDAQKRSFHVYASRLERGPGVQDDELEIRVVKGGVGHRFVFFSKLAPPLSSSYQGEVPTPPFALLSPAQRVSATRWKGVGALQVKFSPEASFSSETGTAAKGETHDILEDGGPYTLLFPSNEDIPIPAQYSPPGIGRPCALALPEGKTALVAYRAADGEIHCLIDGERGWRLLAPSIEGRQFDPQRVMRAATGDPDAYAVLKTGSGKRGVLCLAYAAGPDLLELVLEPKPSAQRGDPELLDPELLGTWRVERIHHGRSAKDHPVGKPLGGLFQPSRGVTFLVADGRLLGVVQSGDERTWSTITLNSRGPKAVGEPAGFVALGGISPGAKVLRRHLYYLGDDGNVHELISDERGRNWTADNITRGLNGYEPPARNATLSAYPFYRELSVHLVYRDRHGHVHELVKDRQGKWSHAMIAAQTRFAAGNPVGYATEYASTRHVVFRDADGEAVELWWHQKKWREIPLGQKIKRETGCLSDLAGISFEKDQTQMLFYLGEDRRPRRLREKGGWKFDDCRLSGLLPDPLAPLAAPFFYEAGDREDSFFVEPYVLETMTHEWTGWIVTTREFVPARPSGVDLQVLHEAFEGWRPPVDNPDGLLRIDERYRKSDRPIAPGLKVIRGIEVH